ncbi:MAG: branched-chain amino acid ABC transporter permease [Hyphomicrobiaceae bacterium]
MPALLSFRGGLLLIVLILGGCAALDDAGEARLCRLLIPVLNSDASGVRLVSTRRLTNDRGVRLLYRVNTGDTETHLRSLTCRFDPLRSGAAEPRHLTRVDTEEGALSAARLYFLKRFWLESPGTGAADPAPIANADQVTEISRPAAMTLQNVVAALPQMSVYGLLAAAYALVYGLVGRINLAFGDFAVLGSFGALIGLVATSSGGTVTAGIIAALLVAVWTATIHGAAIGRLVFFPVSAQRGQVALIASTGLALFLAEYARVAQGSTMRWTPPFFNAPVGLARSGDFIVTVTPMAMATTLVALASGCTLVILMRRSRLGRYWRACADDPFAAALMGLSPARVLLVTFAVASFLAGLGGAVTTLYYGGVTYSGGLIVGLKALIAAILGGIGSVPGAFAGGLLLGAAEALWSSVFPIELRDPAIYVLLAVALVLRPGGLLGLPEVDTRRT